MHKINTNNNKLKDDKVKDLIRNHFEDLIAMFFSIGGTEISRRNDEVKEQMERYRSHHNKHRPVSVSRRVTKFWEFVHKSPERQRHVNHKEENDIDDDSVPRLFKPLVVYDSHAQVKDEVAKTQTTKEVKYRYEFVLCSVLVSRADVVPNDLFRSWGLMAISLFWLLE